MRTDQDSATLPTRGGNPRDSPCQSFIRDPLASLDHAATVDDDRCVHLVELCIERLELVPPGCNDRGTRAEKSGSRRIRIFDNQCYDETDDPISFEIECIVARRWPTPTLPKEPASDSNAVRKDLTGSLNV